MIEMHKKLIAIIIIVFFIMVLLCCGIYTIVDNMASEAVKASVISTAANPNSENETPTPDSVVTPPPTPTKKTPTPKPQPKVYNFTPGHYLSGRDFDPGTYDVEAISGKGNVYSSNILDGGLNDIMSSVKDEYFNNINKNIRFQKNTELAIMGVTVKLTKK
jgi:hypothetical protein